ncbi:entry exclusion lipoprotein TrbK [Pseudomonas sp.]|uniref:entry exclusion lipoprotein TrbK n=1 Tax=Pseudomonas sp. TaxID=306 RepID=UPI001B1BB188|nr:entry exclusion lipoprotein TrbK [Pseudomonas sp.]MBO9548062.1 entry exclusion lipoprotein TrbK [Pseudomonas sp.]
MIRKFLLLIVVAVLLAACGDDSSHYAVSDEHCQPDRLKTLPNNPSRDTLVEKCMPRPSP